MSVKKQNRAAFYAAARVTARRAAEAAKSPYAILTIRTPLSDADARNCADWLRRLARDLRARHRKYAPTFRARLFR